MCLPGPKRSCYFPYKEVRLTSGLYSLSFTSTDSGLKSTRASNADCFFSPYQLCDLATLTRNKFWRKIHRQKEFLRATQKRVLDTVLDLGTSLENGVVVSKKFLRFTIVIVFVCTIFCCCLGWDQDTDWPLINSSTRIRRSCRKYYVMYKWIQQFGERSIWHTDMKEISDTQ